MRRIGLDLHVEHSGEATESLSADAQRVHLIHDLEAQRFELVLRAALADFVNVDGLEQRFLGEHHRFFSGSANADAEHARRTPACAHRRHGLHEPVDDRIGRVEHRELGFVLRAAAFRSECDLDFAAGHDFHVDDGRRVVFRVLTIEVRIVHDGGTQHVVGMVVRAAHTFVDHVRETHGGVPANVHAHLHEYGHDAGVLTDRAMTFGAHARVHQDLLDRIFGRRAFLELVGPRHRGDEVRRVVVRNVLERVGDALNHIVLANHSARGSWGNWLG